MHLHPRGLLHIAQEHHEYACSVCGTCVPLQTAGRPSKLIGKWYGLSMVCVTWHQGCNTVTGCVRPSCCTSLATTQHQVDAGSRPAHQSMKAAALRYRSAPGYLALTPNSIALPPAQPRCLMAAPNYALPPCTQPRWAFACAAMIGHALPPPPVQPEMSASTKWSRNKTAWQCMYVPILHNLG